MEKWRDLNTKRNKEKEKKKNSRKGRVACRKEGGSFLIFFKVRLRVIHKKKKNREKEELEREAPSSL